LLALEAGLDDEGFHDLSFSRRSFLGAAGTAAATALATGSTLRAATAATPALPAPGASGIDHIIVVMMENRSFDHFLGWMPGADGKQSGLSYTDRYGIPHSTHHLNDFQGCGHPDPDHSYEGGRNQFKEGNNNGWLLAGEKDEFAVG
jgi:phospholipase C